MDAVKGSRASGAVIEAHAFFGENEDVSRDPTHAKVKAMYDALKNCHKQMVYRDPGNWFIAIA